MGALWVRGKAMSDQFYLFTVPGDDFIWCEMYTRAEGHLVAPTPHLEMSSALTALSAREPSATVDELDRADDLAEVREWARTRPLEPLPM
jgi:hypothetical protein